jgi:hypothetical protein
MKKSSKFKKAKKHSIAKINNSERSKAAAKLVKTGSKLDQIISCDEQQDHQMSEYSKDVDEEDEDNDLKEFFSSNRKKIEEEKRREEEWKEEEVDKKFEEWKEDVKKEHGSLDNFLASHDAAIHAAVRKEIENLKKDLFKPRY